MSPPPPTAEQLAAQLAQSPDAYPQKIDLVREALLVVLIDADAYRAASFLDDRMLGPAIRGGWVPLAAAAAAARRIASARPLHFVFHTGHVGSTLASRLLDETGSVLSLREPLPLRTLADAHDALGGVDSLLDDARFDAIATATTALWSRGYASTRAVVVKATSSAGRLAGTLLARNPASRAIYMNLGAEPYLAALLAGANSPADLRGHGPERIRRLRSRLAAPLEPLHALSLGELAAMSWLAESLSARAAIDRFPERVLGVDFDAFLADVPAAMLRIADHLGVPHDAGYASAIARSRTLGRYSKAPQHAYSPQERAQVMRESRQANAVEIGKGLAWLERLARADAGVAAVVG